MKEHSDVGRTVPEGGAFDEVERVICGHLDRCTTLILDALERSQGRMPAMLDRAAVSRLLSISTRTLDRMIAEGAFPEGRLVGRSRRWSQDTVERWLSGEKKRQR